MLNVNVSERRRTSLYHPSIPTPGHHSPTVSQEERSKLDQLMAAAMLDGSIAERLLNGQDDSLLAAFSLAEETRYWLRSIRATSLVDLAQQIVALW